MQDIVDGFVTALRVIPDVAVFSEPKEGVAPFLVVWPPSIDSYNATFGRSLCRSSLEVWLATGPVGPGIDVSVRELWRYADVEGAHSVLGALAADRTLGGALEDLVVRSFRPGMEEMGGVSFVVGVWTVDIAWRFGSD